MTLLSAVLSDSVTVTQARDLPPVLLVHGVHLGRYSWQPHVELLKDTFQVATLDLPRHGTMAATAFTDETVSQQLQFVVETVLKRPAILVGYSLGGFALMRFARAHPELSRGLLAAGASLELGGWQQCAYTVSTAIAQYLPRPLFQRASRAFFRASLEPGLAEAIIQNPFDARAFPEIHTYLSGERYSEMLDDYPHPVLFANGEYDVIFRPQSERFAARSGAQSTIVRGSDHVFPLRRPAEFSAIIRDFAMRCALLGGGNFSGGND